MSKNHQICLKNIATISIFRFKKSGKNQEKIQKKKKIKFFFAHKIHICGLKSKSTWLRPSFGTKINASMELAQKLSDPVPSTGLLRRGGSVKSQNQPSF